MAEGKTVPELTPETLPIVGTDAAVIYRAPGPLKRATAADLRTYMQANSALKSANGSDFAIPLNGASGSGLVGYLANGANAVARTAQSKLRDAAVSPADFGAVGDGVANDTAALKAMFVSGARRFNLGKDKTYRVVMSQGDFLAKFIGGQVDIYGENVLILDETPNYTNDGAFTQIFWGVGTSRFSSVGVNYEGPAIANPLVDLGYIGASFVRVTEAAQNTHVIANVKNLRHGVHSGDYTLWDLGYCSGFTGRITGQWVGYPQALYLADECHLDLDVDDVHRVSYLAGCQKITGTYRYKNLYVASIASLLTDSKTSASTARGVSSYHAKVFDKGSTVYPTNSRAVGISPSWSYDGTTYDDIDLHAVVISTDAIASKIGHAASYSVDLVAEWKTTQKITNLRVSGLLDRSAQTTTEQDVSGEIYISGLSGVHGDGKFVQIEGFSVDDFVYKPGSGSKPRGFWFLMPGLVGRASVEGVNFGDAPVYWGTNATSLSQFTSCRLLGSWPGTSDSPYLSQLAFDNCEITASASQPTTNKRFVNTLIQGGGTALERFVTELTLAGATTTWSNSLPNNCFILGVTGRVTEAIATGSPAGCLVGVATNTDQFANIATNAAGTTFTPANGDGAQAFYQVGTGSVVVTRKDAAGTGGKIRLTVDFIRFTPPSS
jgi:hypothetical protein